MRRIAALASLVLAPAAFGQTFSGLGFLPGGTSSWASDISEDGTTVVGDTPNQSWRWTSGGGMQGLGLLPGYTDFPTVGGVSRDGSMIVGNAANPAIGAWLPYLWTSTGLAPLDGQITDSSSLGLSGNGAVAVGSSSLERAFRSQAGVRQSIGPLLGSPYGAASSSIAFAANYDGAVVVGSAEAHVAPPNTTTVFIPFRWTAATGMQAMLQSNGQLFQGSAGDVSADGSIIAGSSYDGNSLFRWTQSSGYQLITALSGVGGPYPVRISGDGSTIIGHTTVWTAATGAFSLQQVLTDAGDNFSGWSLTKATGISYDSTVLCGEGIDPNGQREAWIATVPAPASGLVLLPGLLALRRRR